MASIHVNLFLFVLIAALSSTHAGAIKNKLQPRIVGGEDASTRDFPHVVGIFLEYGMIIGGGSIISDRYILTSASYVNDFIEMPYALIAILGADTFDDEAVTLEIERITLHPDFNEDELKNDLAMLLTEAIIQYTPTIQSIPLPVHDLRSHVNDLAVIGGWGLLEEPIQDLKQANHFQFLRTQTISLTDCIQRYDVLAISDMDSFHEFVGRFNENIVCTSNPNGRGLCAGDAGNGLIVNGTLVAVSSWTNGCGKGFPDVHTKVYPYLNWILTELENVPVDQY